MDYDPYFGYMPNNPEQQNVGNFSNLNLSFHGVPNEAWIDDFSKSFLQNDQVIEYEGKYNCSVSGFHEVLTCLKSITPARQV
jgi:hypothetical protein